MQSIQALDCRLFNHSPITVLWWLTLYAGQFLPVPSLDFHSPELFTTLNDVHIASLQWLGSGSPVTISFYTLERECQAVFRPRVHPSGRSSRH